MRWIKSKNEGKIFNSIYALWNFFCARFNLEISIGTLMMRKIPELKISEFWIVTIMTSMIFVSGFAFLYWTGKLENLPTFFVAVIATALSGLSYINARDKVRLELFKQRYETYQSCLSVCRAILIHGDIPNAKKFAEDRQNFEKAVNRSFRGEGFHLSSFLFGPDVKPLFDQLNSMYSHLSTYSSSTLREMDPAQSEKAAREKFEYFSRVWDIVNKDLPNTFNRYLDMSDYKKFQIKIGLSPKT